MLDVEEARKRLSALRDRGWAGRRLRRIVLFPRELRSAIKEALKERERPYLGYLEQEELVTRLRQAFAALPDAKRAKLFRALFPRIGEHLERAWTSFPTLPYTRGVARRPFRAPDDPELLSEVRAAWFLDLLRTLQGFDFDAPWVAAWAPHLETWYYGSSLGWLLAAAIDGGGTEGEAVYETLTDSARGRHEIGGMGRHVVRALLGTAREDAWRFVMDLLLAAQRQEGLRQSILETVDESHPEAFRRVLDLVLEENLLRFSATVRAADVWFGFGEDAADARVLGAAIADVRPMLDDEDAREAARLGDDPARAYLALWAGAYRDAPRTIAGAAELLAHEEEGHRFAATHFLGQTILSSAWPALADALGDPDLRIVRCALDALGSVAAAAQAVPDLFARYERLMPRVPKKRTSLEPLVWSWATQTIAARDVATAMTWALGGRAATELLPWVQHLEPLDRAAVARSLSGLPSPWDARRGITPRDPKEPLEPSSREALLGFLGDSSADVRAVAFEALAPLPLEDDEVARLEDLLKRKAGDLRAKALSRLATLNEVRLRATAERLLQAQEAGRRAAGSELLREMAVEEPPTLDDALGLLSPGYTDRARAPKERAVEASTPAAKACHAALLALVEEHRDSEVELTHWYSDKERLLGNAAHLLPEPRVGVSYEDDALRFPLADVWTAWADARPPALYDADGLELARAWSVAEPPYRDPDHWRYAIAHWVLPWLLKRTPPPAAPDFVLGLLSRALGGAKHPDAVDAGLHAARRLRDATAAAWGPTHHARFVHVVRTCSKRVPWPRLVTLDEVVAAYAAGRLGPDEFVRALIGPRGQGLTEWRAELSPSTWHWSGSLGFDLLRQASARRPPPTLAAHAELVETVDRCRRRLIEVECARGDLATASTHAVVELRWTGGLEAVVPAVQRLGREKLTRQHVWGEPSRKDALSHLVAASWPRAEDTPEAFAAAVAAAGIQERRLLEIAIYAPAWSTHVQHALDWPGLDDAVWWFHAHTKSSGWGRHEHVRDAWEAQVGGRTPLTAGDLEDGAVDVAWFRRAYETLGRERWQALSKAAKYASSAGGHKRAELFARAMTGEVEEAELFQRIDEKRHQDPVRALGLLPLPEGEDGREVLHRRYERMQAFRRESRRFGSQRRASEGRAVEIGLDNLARTAGYADPLRLQWALETEAVADLAAGPVVIERGEVRIALALDDDGSPDVSVVKGERRLKAVPAKLKKDPEVKALLDRTKDLRRQRARIRESLEGAMCRGDAFTGAELRLLFRHPVLAEMLCRLVVAAPNALGFPVDSGAALECHDGSCVALGDAAEVRIAHAHDLYTWGDWHRWQRVCFARERVQPFKQVFRELYLLTKGERADATFSRRYEGHQVGPGQALALFKTRGWVVAPEEGVFKTYHHEDVTAAVYFDYLPYTPAEVDGTTLERVTFWPRGDPRKPLALEAVSARVFSETMRDLDLVVSVAHLGGVDPEATASTVEMRSALIRETCRLLSLDNVEVKGRHATIEGALARYALHLGSGQVHVLPGQALCIIPVRSQRRGRLFLPFADDDPKTAEILSKTLLLARDAKIQDPTILEQIRR